MSVPDHTSEIDLQEFLLFKLGGNLYGTELLSVQEIILPQPYKSIPNAEPYFLGMINLRGHIVGVLDLRLKFSLDPVSRRGNALLMFHSDHGMVGALVDEIIEVVTIDDKAIEKDPHISSPVPLDFIEAVAHHDDRLVTILDLRKIVSQSSILGNLPPTEHADAQAE